MASARVPLHTSRVSVARQEGDTYTYDANGNTVSNTAGTSVTTYMWGFENRLTSVSLPNGGGTVTLNYDPFGRRIRKIAPGGATTIYAYDGDVE